MFLDFNSLVPVDVPASIGGKRYALCEASGDAACQYRNCVLKSTRMEDGHVASVDGLADAEPLLVSLCLYQLEEREPQRAKFRTVLKGEEAFGYLVLTTEGVPDPKNRATLRFVRSLPSRVQKSLFETCKEISELSELGDTEEGLQRQIQKAQEKLDKLKAEEEAAKNGPPGTGGG